MNECINPLREPGFFLCHTGFRASDDKKYSLKLGVVSDYFVTQVVPLALSRVIIESNELIKLNKTQLLGKFAAYLLNRVC